MHRQAFMTITDGLGLGARVVLGAAALLFGLLTLLASEHQEESGLQHVFTAFCLWIFVACFTKGRVRQFVGSAIGTAVFLVSLIYLVSEITRGVWWSWRDGAPSVHQAARFMFFFGLPGAIYAIGARFGLHHATDEHVRTDHTEITTP